MVTIRTTLETLRDTVPASESEAYFKMLDRIDDSRGYGVDQRALPVVPTQREEFPKSVIVIIVAVGTWGAFVVGRNAHDRIRRGRRIRRNTPREGEVAGRAVVVRSEAEMLAQIEKLRCSCGARWSENPGERLWSEATLEGRTLSAVRTSCHACGEWTRCWFDRTSFASPSEEG